MRKPEVHYNKPHLAAAESHISDAQPVDALGISSLSPPISLSLSLSFSLSHTVRMESWSPAVIRTVSVCLGHDPEGTELQKQLIK